MPTRRVIRRKRVTKRGKGWWSDFADGFKSVVDPAISIGKTLLPLAPLVGLGRKRRVVRRKRVARRGRGFLDSVKSLYNKAKGYHGTLANAYNKHSKASTISGILRDVGLNKQADWVKRTTGLGRRRVGRGRVVRRGAGLGSITPGCGGVGMIACR